MRNVLILAREEVVAALLGLMVELHGYQPKFVDRSESVDEHEVQAVAARHGVRSFTLPTDPGTFENMLDT